ncbi:hypothetical protein NDA11_007218 [Ustilago hordei]|uniref:Related to PPR1-transcription factor regulating pyrimidine pathway n=1 Tax=Ustilago hordei TaxID=120017 RepID=I2G537_USTHO|nr:uncharacterized protein UHO2_01449 [Ustilago hordei]KAJ1044761.1 hypothetical protein NDA10_004645 [Ustilago hordei]KAJ1586877.1 hypothetical protein NDA11_007218 [Ustilago hordei]KAJ1603174.1 hypothetical protein NDA14_004318 [Ustilago hordei]UTT94626.1 hypothetical protein NDA17_004294 [Ustilago hordei]CCF54280.1 related to PPR1-transcription factor regulating pyrimidine pathway [Ustilago hordei]
MASTNSGSNGEPGGFSNEVGPSTSTSAKPAKRKSEKARSSPATADTLDANGTKPLARAVLVCKRCRSKKIKCDQAFPACGSCVKAGEPCVGIDSATGREVSRSYIVDLEHQLAELRAQNAELERLLAERSASRPADEASLGLKRPLQHVKHEFPLDRSESATSPELRPSKRLATSPRDERGQESSNPLLSGLLLGPSGVEVLPSKPDDQQAPSLLRPSLGRLHSHASGLSPARLLCQAIQQSAQAGLRIRDPGSSARARRFGAQTLSEDLGRRARSNAREPSQLPFESKENASKIEARNGSPHSGTATPSESKKYSPFDDGDPMQYATATETADITVPAPEQALKPSPLPAPFPPLSIARKLIDAYFERVNPQLPILDRSSFMARFEKACRIGLEKARTKLSPEELNYQGDDDDKLTIELQPADGHLFHLVFAIAAAMGWTRSSWSAENHHEAAMRFLDPRRHANSGMEGNVGAIMGRDALEQLQCLLLTALYSIMRPMKPGVWYCLGVALRLTTGIGLYTETPGVLEASSSISQDSGESLIERKRRLFWCSYALDRQVCVHLGRPFGIADSDIKVNLPWVDSETDMIKVPIGDGQGRVQGAEAAEDDVDSLTEFARREAASTLAALQSSTTDQASPGPVSLPKPKDASRWVSLSFFRMRLLQSEIQSMLYQNAELPRRFDSYAHWKTDILRRLHAWRRYAPSSKQDLEASECGYNPIFLDLNYQQTLLMVYGLSPRFPHASRKDLANVEDCSRSIINMYATLSKEGQMNYTWMTGHNVFIACTSYLYAIWQISATDPSSFRSSLTLGFRNKVDEIHHFAAACDKVLASLQWATAEKCRKCLRTMFYATSMVVEKIDRSASTRGGGQARADAASDRLNEDSMESKRAGDSSVAKTQTQPRTQVHAEHTPAHVSQASKRVGPSSPSAPAWALYAQERDWRSSAPNNTIESALAPPHGDLSHSPAWTQRPQGRASPVPATAWPSDSEAASYRRDSGSGRRMHSNFGERSRLASMSADAYASDATTPSRGLDMGSSLVDAPNTGNSWYGFGSEASPKILFPDSPSNIDISSLMATSAMELDSLFREAGMSAGPAGEQRGWMNSETILQQGGSMTATNFGFGESREQPASQYGQSARPSSFYDPVASGTHQADGKAKRAFDADATRNVEPQSGGVAMIDGEGFDTDWEALGFGYRMTTPTHHRGSTPMFADSVNQQQQQDFGSVRGGLQQTGQSAYINREAPGFDYRYLDSHMGF